MDMSVIDVCCTLFVLAPGRQVSRTAEVFWCLTDCVLLCMASRMNQKNEPQSVKAKQNFTYSSCFFIVAVPLGAGLYERGHPGV